MDLPFGTHQPASSHQLAYVARIAGHSEFESNSVLRQNADVLKDGI